MIDEANEAKKTTVLARVERLRELLEEDAEAPILEQAYREIGRELDGLIRPGRAGGTSRRWRPWASRRRPSERWPENTDSPPGRGASRRLWNWASRAGRLIDRPARET